MLCSPQGEQKTSIPISREKAESSVGSALMARLKNKNAVHNSSNFIPIGRNTDRYTLSLDILKTEVEIESGNELWPIGVAAPKQQPETAVKMPTATTVLLSTAEALRSARELSLPHRRAENNNGQFAFELERLCTCAILVSRW